MTVDMLAAAFIWPEEMLLGRIHTRDEPDPDLTDDAASDETSAPKPDATPFWAAVMRRFRADPPVSGAEIR